MKMSAFSMGRMKMKKLLSFLVAFAVMTSTALAAPPVPNEGTIVFPAGSVFGECAFDVQGTLTGKTKTITLPGDRLIITSPGAHITLTNLSDPSKTVTLNITGSFHQSTTQAGDMLTVVTGRNLLGDPDAGFVLAIGNFSFAFHGSVLVQPLIGNGQLIHVCTLIS
jgi:hypothetical protein